MGAMWRVIFVVLVSGCDLIFPLTDPTSPIGGGGDAAVQPCDHGAPVAPGTPVSLQTTESIEAARFSPDRSLIYLSLCDTGEKTKCELYTGTLNATGQYGSFAKLEISAPGFYDSYPTITRDSRYIVFGSTRDGEVKVFVGEENNGRFMNPMAIDVAGQQAANEPYILGDSTLYVSGGNGSDNALYVAKGMTGDFAEVEGVSVAGAKDFAPVVTDDELEIFFASNRQSPGGTPALDIYTATRTRPDLPFEMPTRVAELSDPASIDWPLWISPDHCDLYYINKVGTQATLFVTSRR